MTLAEMQKRHARQLIAAALLGGFAMLGTTLVAVTYDHTFKIIEENKRQALIRQLDQLISKQSIDNDPLSDVINISAPQSLNTNSTKVYRARKDNQPVAAVFSPVVARGYAGPITLIVAVRHNGTLAGVRVLQHHETPGLGDKIDERRSDWIFGFTGKTIQDPGPEGWNLRRDGGVFDQFAGASITPRGVIKAVHATLKYFHANQDYLFEQPMQLPKVFE